MCNRKIPLLHQVEECRQRCQSTKNGNVNSTDSVEKTGLENSQDFWIQQILSKRKKTHAQHGWIAQFIIFGFQQILSKRKKWFGNRKMESTDSVEKQFCECAKKNLESTDSVEKHFCASANTCHKAKETHGYCQALRGKKICRKQ